MYIANLSAIKIENSIFIEDHLLWINLIRTCVTNKDVLSRTKLI